MKTTFAFFGTMLALCVAVQNVKADVVTTVWDFSTSVSITGVDGKNEHFEQESDGHITWGDPSAVSGSNPNKEKSGAKLEGNSGTIQTDSTDGAIAATFTHYNNVLKENTGGVKGMTVQLDLSISAANSGFSFDLDSLVLKLGFYETPNNTKRNNKIYDEDIFYILDSGSVIEQKFTYDGNDYLVTLTSALNELSGEYLAMAQERLGVDSETMVYGWTTAENSSTPTEFPFTIMVSTIERQATTTPEPATLAIFGLGILGAGFAARRRNAK